MKQKIIDKSFVTHAVTSLLYITTIVYCSGFVYLLFFARRRREMADRYLAVIPFKSTINNFLKIESNDHRELFNFYSNLFGNIILFLPFPFFLACLAGIKSFKKVLLISFILSLSVELLQYVFKRGVADIDDVLLNLLGATIGFFIYRLLWPVSERNGKR